MASHGAFDAGPSALHVQVGALEVKLAAEEQVLRDARAREAVEGGNVLAGDRLANARLCRDNARQEAQRAQTKLSAMMVKRRACSRKLDKLLIKQNQKQAAVSDPGLALPSVALRGGSDEAASEEIRALMKENKELEEALAQHHGTRLHLEKLQNEKRDMARRIKELKHEDKLIKDQIAMKTTELRELQESIKPSPVRQRYEAEVARLRKQINAHSAVRTAAEREAAVHAKRLLRVRSVLGAFLKNEGLKPQQPLPVADEALAQKLCEHVVALAEKVRSLERTVGAREERAAALESQSAQAAAQLKKLVARRGAAQRKNAVGMLTEPIAEVETPGGQPTEPARVEVRRGKTKAKPTGCGGEEPKAPSAAHQSAPDMPTLEPDLDASAAVAA